MYCIRVHISLFLSFPTIARASIQVCTLSSFLLKTRALFVFTASWLEPVLLCLKAGFEKNFVSKTDDVNKVVG